MTDSDQFIVEPLKDERTAQESTNRERAGAGTSSRSQEATSNDEYTHESDKCNDRAEPCSWREMYRAMEAVLPCHE
jgi:hypothetical protein